MAKQRPQLQTFASPVSQLVSPVQEQAQPLNEQEIRNLYQFADSFRELSTTVGELAITLQKESNRESMQVGREMVNANRKTYADLVKSGQINPSENPYMAIGAQQASGALEASKAKTEFQMEYDRQISNNPDLMADNNFFDALASSFAQNKSSQFGNAPYLSDSFFDSFNPYLNEMAMNHSQNVVKYRTGKIIQSLKVRVSDSLSELGEVRSRFGLREDGGGYKDVGFLGPQYGIDGDSEMTELSTSVEIDGRRITMPMLVPGLSLQGREKLVYGGAGFGDLSREDQKTIVDHAIARMQEEKSPFYDSLADKIVPEIQAFMDEMGMNMGMPRAANMAVVSQLIDAMANSPSTYDAEAILRKLNGGTGPLAETEEVKAMLASASSDIAKNRFQLQNANEKSMAGMFLLSAYEAAFESGNKLDSEVGYEETFDSYMKLLSGFTTFSPEDVGKARDQFNEVWNSGVREGEESMDRQDLRLVTGVFNNQVEMAVRQASGSIVNWPQLSRQLDDTLNMYGVSGDSPQHKNARKNVRAIVTTQLEQIRLSALQQLNANAQAFGVAPGSIETLEILSTDSAQLRDAKDTLRHRVKLNEFEAAVSFGLEDRLAGFRQIGLNGFSVDVERGVRTDIKDLIYIYESVSGGRGSVQAVFGTGELGKRIEAFLDGVVRKKSGGMTLENAVRDTAQQLNLEGPQDIAKKLDYSPQSPELLNIKAAIDGVEASLTRSRRWFGWLGVGQGLNPDARAPMVGMFTRKYMEIYSQTVGSHEQALEGAVDYLNDGTFYVRGSLIPKDEFVSRNVDEEYIHDFIDLEAGFPSQDPSLVIVGYGSRGQAVYALRTADGNAINNRYYTADDITSNARPRDERGNVIPGALSPYERVQQARGRKKQNQDRVPPEIMFRTPSSMKQ